MNNNFHLDCPDCGVKRNKVKTLTLQTLLRPRYLYSLTHDQYRFCATGDCDTVYYSENSDQVFHKDTLRVRVGIKEKNNPRPVCYCFNHNIESIELEIRATGKSTASEDIKTRLQDGCWCETRNPQGRCCVGLVRQIEKNLMATTNFSKSEDTDPQ